MRAKQIANKFLKNQNEEKATNYLKNENLYDLLIDLSNELQIIILQILET